MRGWLVFLMGVLAEAQSELSVRVADIKGSVETRAAVDAAWEPLTVQTELKKGAWVQTGLRSRVFLQFGESTVVLVKSATLVEIDEALRDQGIATGRLKLALGAVKVDVHKTAETVDFKVQTPQVTTSVKGTNYLVTHGTHFGSEVSVDRGRVEVANAMASRDVLPGMMTDARLLPPDILGRMDQMFWLPFDALKKEMQLNQFAQYAGISMDSIQFTPLNAQFLNYSVDSLKSVTTATTITTANLQLNTANINN